MTYGGMSLTTNPWLYDFMHSNIHKVDEVGKFLPQQWYLLIYHYHKGNIFKHTEFSLKALAINNHD